MKKNKVDMIKNYELLLKKVEKTFDALYLCHNKLEFLNLMKEKGIDANNSQTNSQQRKNVRKGTKKFTTRGNRRYVKTQSYQIIAEDKNEEDDKSNYDPDAKILREFLKEQQKEKDNYISGKTKIEVKK